MNLIRNNLIRNKRNNLINPLQPSVAFLFPQKKKRTLNSFDQMFFAEISKYIFRISEKSRYSPQDSIFLAIYTITAAID